MMTVKHHMEGLDKEICSENRLWVECDVGVCRYIVGMCAGVVPLIAQKSITRHTHEIHRSDMAFNYNCI
jgi:hypothetical protein